MAVGDLATAVGAFYSCSSDLRRAGKLQDYGRDSAGGFVLELPCDAKQAASRGAKATIITPSDISGLTQS